MENNTEENYLILFHKNSHSVWFAGELEESFDEYTEVRPSSLNNLENEIKKLLGHVEWHKEEEKKRILLTIYKGSKKVYCYNVLFNGTFDDCWMYEEYDPEIEKIANKALVELNLKK